MTFFENSILSAFLPVLLENMQFLTSIFAKYDINNEEDFSSNETSDTLTLDSLGGIFRKNEFKLHEIKRIPEFFVPLHLHLLILTLSTLNYH